MFWEKGRDFSLQKWEICLQRWQREQIEENLYLTNNCSQSHFESGRNHKGEMMSFTKTERLMLINQYEILKRLDTENSDDYEEKILILRNGYEIFYSSIDEHIYPKMKVDDGDFVLQILNFYRMVEDYKKANPDDKEIADHAWGHFNGFSGNDEGEYFGFARFLVNDQKKFQEQIPYFSKNDRMNSHIPLKPVYLLILHEWEKRGSRFQLTREAILEILNSVK